MKVLPPTPYKCMQVLEALPQLQTLDDVRLNRPLSPLSKIAAAHRHVANGHTASATPYIHAGPSSQAQPADTALASRWYPQHLSLTISNGSHSGRSLQRPRSAGGIPQRLPPVASGRNQPGSFLLHSITQSLPPDPLLVALGEAPGPSTEKTGPQTMLSTREDLISQLCSDARKQESSLESVDALSSYSTGEAERAGRTARPASAGFRRPGAAQAIIAPDTSRCQPSLS